MNTATVRWRQAPKRPPIPNAPVITTLGRDAQSKIFLADDLRRRWEQIVSKGRS